MITFMILIFKLCLFPLYFMLWLFKAAFWLLFAIFGTAIDDGKGWQRRPEICFRESDSGFGRKEHADVAV